MLREYQQRAIDDLYAWFSDGGRGNPCLVLPTGSGKSHIVAALCKDALQNWPDTRILMLTHVKELIIQNAEKMRQHWPNAPLGIYSAGVGLKQAGEPITFAGIQSVAKKSDLIGHIDIAIIDECHLVSHKGQGSYILLLDALKKINPALRVVGLTATPYRLGHGLITDKPAIFDALIDPVSIEELVHKGFLSTLRSKTTVKKLDTEGVKKKGGEYVESELQAAVDTKEANAAVVAEVIKLAGDRKAWLFFCAGVDHALNVEDELLLQGINARCVTGDTPKAERAQILDDFKSGKIRALTNANVLTTGFDYPDIDLIAMLRPTMSPSLYVQMAGRGMRTKSHTDHCLVLDFAGVVEQHGPITAVQPPAKKCVAEGKAPVKSCDQCGEIVHASTRQCTACGFEFPAPEAKPLVLRNHDIMGIEASDMSVTGWTWRKHVSRSSGKPMLAVTYYGGLSDRPVTEYFPVTHDGLAGAKALKAVAQIAQNAKVVDGGMAAGSLDAIAKVLREATPPTSIKYKSESKFHRVTERVWG